MSIDEKALAATLDVSERREWDNITASIKYYESVKGVSEQPDIEAIQRDFYKTGFDDAKRQYEPVAHQPVGCRELFEQEFNELDHAKDGWGSYTNRETNAAWGGFLAAWSLRGASKEELRKSSAENAGAVRTPLALSETEEDKVYCLIRDILSDDPFETDDESGISMRIIESIRPYLCKPVRESGEPYVWLDDPRTKIMLEGWGAIQKSLHNEAVQGHIRGWNIQPIPEAVRAQQLWEGLAKGDEIEGGK